MPQAIEEALRWEPPLLITSRVCARDTELRGVPIPAGAHVTVMLGAANRDESRYPDPDRFDIFRDPKQHISFGHGPHTCLGMHLARMETRIAVGALLDRLPNLRLEPGSDDPHIHGQIFRSPTSLPVRFG
jgi:cytochrome P450